MLIYSTEISPRLKYTMDLIFRTMLKIDFKITQNREEFLDYNGPQINYSKENIDGIAYLQSGNLLFEDTIEDQNDNLFSSDKWSGLPIIFPTSSISLVPFDLPAAVFYYVSRYEEYLPFDADKHGRFPSYCSYSSAAGILDQPIVDLWVRKFGEKLNRFYPKQIPVLPPEFKFESTIDIDNAWAFKNKGFLRTAASLLKPGQKMDNRNFRYQVLRGKQHDPYDQFAKMDMIHKEFDIKPLYFFLLGSYGKYDRNISPQNKAFRKLIKDTAAKYQTGIHPSYASSSEPEKIGLEKSTLEDITGRTVKSSRQHYLKLKLPSTYRELKAHGISSDYSMGYADNSGFRAGTAHPFKFFDLENNTTTDLVVHSFQVMDTGLRDYEGLNPEQAVLMIEKLMNRVKETGGTFRCLWHNESFSEWKGWEAWTRVYKKMLEMATSA